MKIDVKKENRILSEDLSLLGTKIRLVYNPDWEDFVDEDMNVDIELKEGASFQFFNFESDSGDSTCIIVFKEDDPLEFVGFTYRIFMKAIANISLYDHESFESLQSPVYENVFKDFYCSLQCTIWEMTSAEREKED